MRLQLVIVLYSANANFSKMQEICTFRCVINFNLFSMCTRKELIDLKQCARPFSQDETWQIRIYMV